MSSVIAAPELIATAATDLRNIGSTLSAAHTAAATSTTAMVAAAEDEVSAAIAAVFSVHGQGFQAVGAHAAAFRAQFVQALTAGARSYVSAEAANVAAFTANPAQTIGRDLLGPINAPTLALFGRPLIGNGASAATGITQAANILATDIFGSPPGAPIPATHGAIFTGTPSLATKYQIGSLFALKDVAGYLPPNLDTQLSRVTGALFSLEFSNTPPKFLPLLLGETVQHTTFDGMPVLQITPAHPSGHYVVALPGGDYSLEPSFFHWLDYTLMANQTGATIEVPFYPLVQQGGTAGVVVPEIAGFLSMEIAQHGAPNVSLTGDSSGGNLALATVEYMVANNETVPASMVLVSPWLDVTMTNPNIALVHDPLVNSPLIGGLIGGNEPNVGPEWAGNLPENNYLVSPLYGSLKGLPPTSVYAGSLDSLTPDAIVLQQEAATQGAPISFVFANGECHDWVYLTPDGFKLLPQIYQELGI
jgi:triacylglycerol lipase